MRVGWISDHITGKTIILFTLQFLLVAAVLGYSTWRDTGTECARCHGDQERMARLGYPQFYMTQETVEKESRHPNTKCQDCHLGDSRARNPDDAHEGMLAALLVSESGSVLKRKDAHPGALLPQGGDRIREMLPQVKTKEGLTPHPEVRNVLWHDRDLATFNFDPDITRKTCGKSNCHPEELKQFSTTVMGTNFRQRTMTTWLRPYGPQN
jgi:hypothetical protein